MDRRKEPDWPTWCWICSNKLLPTKRRKFHISNKNGEERRTRPADVGRSRSTWWRVLLLARSCALDPSSVRLPHNDGPWKCYSYGHCRFNFWEVYLGRRIQRLGSSFGDLYWAHWCLLGNSSCLRDLLVPSIPLPCQRCNATDKSKEVFALACNILPSLHPCLRHPLPTRLCQEREFKTNLHRFCHPSCSTTIDRPWDSSRLLVRLFGLNTDPEAPPTYSEAVAAPWVMWNRILDTNYLQDRR